MDRNKIVKIITSTKLTSLQKLRRISKNCHDFTWQNSQIEKIQASLEKETRVFEELISIHKALIIAKRNGENVAKNIAAYHITDQEALFEIASVALQCDPWGTLKYLENFQLKRRYEFLVAAVEIRPLPTILYIERYYLTDQSEWHQHNWADIYHEGKRFLWDQSEIYDRQHEIDEDLKHLEIFIKEKNLPFLMAIENLINNVKLEKNVEIRKKLGVWVNLIVFYLSREKNDEVVKVIESKKSIFDVFDELPRLRDF